MTTPPAGGSAADARLSAGLIERDQGALAEAYGLHGGAVRQLAGRLCGQHADDVTQEVFVRLWNRPDGFDPGRGTLRGYVLMLARSRSIDLLRSDVARRRREEAEAASTDRLALPMIGPDGHVGPDDEGPLRLLDRLPLLQREAIALAFVDGHTYREVARLLDQAEGTIKGRIRAGLQALRVLMLEDPPALAS